jgi:ZIP family zinc transporter
MTVLMSNSVLGVLIAATAGIMIYISADELLPNSYDEKSHAPIFALAAGILLVVYLNGLF